MYRSSEQARNDLQDHLAKSAQQSRETAQQCQQNHDALMQDNQRLKQAIETLNAAAATQQ